MNKFWLESYKWGGLIGLVMSAAFLLEQTCTLNGRILLTGFLWIVAAVGYIVMLYRFTKRWRANFPQEDGFSFGNGFSFLLVLISVSALIKGLVQYLYCNVVIGFPEYTDRLISVTSDFMARGGVPASAEQMLATSFEQLREAPTPTIFSTLWDVLSTNLIVGILLSLILAGILKRDPRPFARPE